MTTNLQTPPESVRLSKRCKDQLITLKRKTGVPQWNTLCRWALAVSLAMPSEPPPANEKLEGGVEMAWRVFAGRDADLWWAALLISNSESPGEALRAHIHRGVNQLSAVVRNSVADLAQVSIEGAGR